MALKLLKCYVSWSRGDEQLKSFLNYITSSGIRCVKKNRGEDGEKVFLVNHKDQRDFEEMAEEFGCYVEWKDELVVG